MAIGEDPGAEALDRRMTIGPGGIELLTANPPNCRVTRPYVHNQVASRLIRQWGEYMGTASARDERAAASWFSTCAPAARLEEY